MDPMKIYDRYFEAECTCNGTPRHAAEVMLIAESAGGRIRYEAAVNFFPHEDETDFLITCDAQFPRELYDAPGRRSKKREEAFISGLRETADAIAAEHGGKIFWDRPLGNERRARRWERRIPWEPKPYTAGYSGRNTAPER